MPTIVDHDRAAIDARHAPLSCMIGLSLGRHRGANLHAMELTRIAVHRVADVQLRGPAAPLWARAYWPAPAAPGLVVFFASDGDALCRALCSQAGVVVLLVPVADLAEATTVTEWAADHAAELDADPERLLVAGEGAGADLAAAVAVHARDQGWPALASQVLISPRLPDLPSLAGVAPAVVVAGRRYADRLRRAGFDVQELDHEELAHAVRRIVCANPTNREEVR
jgi:acetyl esterase/lipase